MIFSQYFAFYERNHFLIEAFQKLQGCTNSSDETFILRFISLKQKDKMYLLMIRSIITNRFFKMKAFFNIFLSQQTLKI